MKTTTGSLVIRGALALSVLFMASLAASCKSPLFGLGGQVDTAVPSISVSEVEEGGTPRTLVNGDYVRGTITLRGKASDDLGLASVALSFEDNGATIRLDATIDAAAQSWSATVVTTDYLDGDKDFTVTVTDTAGKASTTRFVLYFDNKPPTVLLTVPSKDEGTASDALYGT
ncbi:MAG TPA: Ig-like domain-containing protein, partial [Spirochaetales bacterium]|nr:Ig-like domain-containing protein [Spirochaetales bacterium]